MIRFHLKREALGESGKKEDFHGYKPKYPTEGVFAEYKVKCMDGEPYIDWGPDSVSLSTPEQLQPYIDHVTVVQHFPSTAKRVMGMYEQEGVTGYLNQKRPEEYVLFMTGPSVEALFVLYRAIRSGKIRPTESWEDAQVPEPPTEPKGSN